MADSPSTQQNRVLAYSVYCGGSKLKDKYTLVSATVHRQLNQIGRATLKVNAGNMDRQLFDESDDDTFRPGTRIRLAAGTINKEETLFEGIITGTRILTDTDARSYMQLECRDCAYPATQGRHNRIFEKKKDSQMIQDVLSAYASVKTDATSYEYPTMVQYYCSDWDFALSRAQAAGLYLVANGQTIVAQKPNVSATPVLTVTYGVDLTAFDLELSTTNQFTGYEAVSWDSATHKTVKVTSSSPTLNKQGDLTRKNLANSNNLLLQTDAPTGTQVLKQWADAAALQAGLSRYQGSCSFYGSVRVEPGCLIELKGLGKRFNGHLFVGSVTHIIEDNQWITRAGAGISSSPDETGVVASTTGYTGFISGLQGIHTAIVKKLDGDPLSEYRIQIELPWLDGQTKLLWARLATVYATSGAGSLFLPEPGDEVIIGFVDRHPAHPVILGSLFGAKNKPAGGKQYEAKNNMKSIVTRSGMKVEFDDEKKSILLVTPGGNTIEVNDEKKLIRLADQHRNSVLMDSNGITLSSAKDLIFKASSGMKLESGTEIKATAKTDLTLEGMNLKMQAKMQASLKGTSGAELSASGQTVVKGALVSIN